MISLKKFTKILVEKILPSLFVIFLLLLFSLQIFYFCKIENQEYIIKTVNEIWLTFFHHL